MILGDELDRHFVFFGDGTFSCFRNRKEVYTNEIVPKVRFLLHPRNPKAFGIGDEEMDSGGYVIKFFDKIDEIPVFKAAHHSFILITKDIFGKDTPFSLEFEHLTGTIKSLQQELETLRGESVRLINELDQIKNRPNEYLNEKSYVFDKVSLIRVKREEPEDDETEEEMR
ncbi:hypothetical protein KY343_06900 [Candidatus Woesearchaeota archaeon]|nr:hypothetical protein [Candidatus Woesearchaeota archaeon]